MLLCMAGKFQLEPPVTMVSANKIHGVGDYEKKRHQDEARDQAQSAKGSPKKRILQRLRSKSASYSFPLSLQEEPVVSKGASGKISSSPDTGEPTSVPVRKSILKKPTAGSSSYGSDLVRPSYTLISSSVAACDKTHSTERKKDEPKREGATTEQSITRTKSLGSNEMPSSPVYSKLKLPMKYSSSVHHVGERENETKHNSATGKKTVSPKRRIVSSFNSVRKSGSENGYNSVKTHPKRTIISNGDLKRKDQPASSTGSASGKVQPSYFGPILDQIDSLVSLYKQSSYIPVARVSAGQSSSELIYSAENGNEKGTDTNSKQGAITGAKKGSDAKTTMDICSSNQNSSNSRWKYTRLINEKLNSAISNKLSSKALAKSDLSELFEHRSNGLVRNDISRIPLHRSPNRNNHRDKSQSKYLSISGPVSPSNKVPVGVNGEFPEPETSVKEDSKPTVQKSCSVPVKGIIRYRRSISMKSPDVIPPNFNCAKNENTILRSALEENQCSSQCVNSKTKAIQSTPSSRTDSNENLSRSSSSVAKLTKSFSMLDHVSNSHNNNQSSESLQKDKKSQFLESNGAKISNTVNSPRRKHLGSPRDKCKKSVRQSILNSSDDNQSKQSPEQRVCQNLGLNSVGNLPNPNPLQPSFSSSNDLHSNSRNLSKKSSSSDYSQKLFKNASHKSLTNLFATSTSVANFLERKALKQNGLVDRWKSQTELGNSSAIVGEHYPVRRAKSSVINITAVRGNPDGQSSTDTVEGEQLSQKAPVKKHPRTAHESKLHTPGWLTNTKLNRAISGTKNSKKLSRSLSQLIDKELDCKPSAVKDSLDIDASVEGSNFSQPSNQTDSSIAVRQCRIGPDLAFGIVSFDQPNVNGYSDSQGLVTIRMKPDFEGKFGFNVKGGSDQGMPIIVSRVAPNTPADLCIPRLNEGDQVLFINGRDVSQHTHAQVVMFIKASRETHSGELVLVVRPNVYLGEDTIEEPDFMYIPETHQITSSAGGNVLEASLLLLQEGLENGAALAQFEQLYRKKMGMTMNAARMPDNVPKNRYRDISPYDQTRVILREGLSGDYINANYVNMEIPGSGIVNRYIAAQGPLPNTCIDFWQMVWEQQASLVVMLTAKVERGRPKCHQYWPDLYETADFGTLQITCVKEEESASFAFRDFNLTHVETNEERHIVHMQYIAWPDHGVPDDSSDFLDFVLKVRQNRVGMVDPTVVHCSAGIGRTGVLITMESAMCLIEANQPVYPLSVVRQMRDQRAMLIQTSSQYKFVCEAILRVFNEGLVKPLEDYKR